MSSYGWREVTVLGLWEQLPEPGNLPDRQHRRQIRRLSCARRTNRPESRTQVAEMTEGIASSMRNDISGPTYPYDDRKLPHDFGGWIPTVYSPTPRTNFGNPNPDQSHALISSGDAIISLIGN